MTEQVDLDALEALIAEKDRWPDDSLVHRLAVALESTRDTGHRIYADALAQAEGLRDELRQERERADEASHAAGRHKSDAALYEAALSLAEETIEAAEDLVTRHYLDTHMGEKVLEILATHKQNGVDDDE